MRTFVVVFLIVIIFVTLVISEKNIIKKFCDKTQLNISKIEKQINQKEKSQNIINTVISDWNKQKKIMYSFANHNIFKEIEAGLFNLKYYIYSDDKVKSIYYLHNIRHKIHELQEINKLDLSNIL